MIRNNNSGYKIGRVSQTYGILVHSMIKLLKADIGKFVGKFGHIHIKSSIAFNQRENKKLPSGLLRARMPVLGVSVGYDPEYNGDVLGASSFMADVSGIHDPTLFTSPIFKLEFPPAKPEYLRKPQGEIRISYKRVSIVMDMAVINNSRAKALDFVEAWSSSKESNNIYSDNLQLEWLLPDDILDAMFDSLELDKSMSPKAKLTVLNKLATKPVKYRYDTSRGVYGYFVCYDSTVLYKISEIENTSESFERSADRFVTKRTYTITFNVPNFLFVNEVESNRLILAKDRNQESTIDDESIALVTDNAQSKYISTYIDNYVLKIDERYKFDTGDSPTIDISPILTPDILAFSEWLLKEGLELDTYIQYAVDTPDYDITIGDVSYDIGNKTITINNYQLDALYGLEVYVDGVVYKHFIQAELAHGIRYEDAFII